MSNIFFDADTNPGVAYELGRYDEQFLHINWKNLQDDIVKWHRTNYPNESKMGAAMAIGEEFGEVARAYVKQESECRGTWDHWQAEKAKEMGDVAIALINAIAHEGFDFESILQQRWKTIRQRNYTESRLTDGRENE